MNHAPEQRDYLRIVAIVVGMLALTVILWPPAGKHVKVQNDGTPPRRMDMGRDDNRLDGNAGADNDLVPSQIRPRVRGVPERSLPTASEAFPPHPHRISDELRSKVIPVDLRCRSFVVTAYCPCKRCCGPRACGITASGKPVSTNGGKFVAAPPEIPFGVRIRVPGYAGDTAVPVADRGGAIKGARLDVFFPSHREALRWGRKTLTCEVVK